MGDETSIITATAAAYNHKLESHEEGNDKSPVPFTVTVIKKKRWGRTNVVKV